MLEGSTLAGYIADGPTPEEAIANLAEARAMHLCGLRQQGLEPPLPGSSPVARLFSAVEADLFVGAERPGL